MFEIGRRPCKNNFQKNYMFSEPLYQFQITMQVLRAIAQFTYFRSYGLSVKVEHIFMDIFGSVSQQCLFHKCASCEYRLNGSKVKN